MFLVMLGEIPCISYINMYYFWTIREKCNNGCGTFIDYMVDKMIITSILF